MNNIFKGLDRKACRVEESSKSNRINNYHRKGKDYKCRYELGYGDFKKAKYVILSLNPGGKGEIKPDEEKKPTYGKFEEYIEGNFSFARNLKKILKWKIKDKSDLYNQFFHANLSIFNSPKKEKDFSIEMIESKDILLSILKGIKPKAIIFIGKSVRNYSFYMLYKAGSKIRIVRNEPIYTCWITDSIVANKVRYIFIPHISGGWSISDKMLTKIGKWLAKDLCHSGHHTELK